MLIAQNIYQIAYNSLMHCLAIMIDLEEIQQKEEIKLQIGKQKSL